MRKVLLVHISSNL